MSVECSDCGNKNHDEKCRFHPRNLIKRKANEQPLKDGGSRVDAGTGGLKEATGGRGAYDLVSPLAIHRLAVHLEKGAAKYGDRNWEKGIKYQRLIQALLRHTYQFLAGMDDEDHLAAMMCNIMFLTHFDALGRTDLDDRPTDIKDALTHMLNLESQING